MNKNSIISERTKLKAEIKLLIVQYQNLRTKEDSLSPFQEEEMFEVMNSIAMRYAKDGFIQKAQVWISKAKPFTRNNPRLAIILHNNAACVYKNQNQYDTALEHLKKSEDILKQIRSKPDYNKRYDRLLVDCWLNLSALYSSKKMHDQALYVINSAEALINHNLQSGFQKFLEQFVIARYNKIVELQYLGKLEQAYYCSDETKRIMYEKRIYKHFLEKKLNDLHQDLRKKLYGQNKHKRTLTLAPSIAKLQESIKLHPPENHSKRLVSVQHKNQTKLVTLLQTKENDNALTSRTTFNSSALQRKPQHKRKMTLAHPLLQLSSSPMTDIINCNIPPR